MTLYIYLQSLCHSIQEVIDSNPHSTVWIAGDLNLPNINWSDNSISGNNYPIPFCNLVLDLFSNAGLAQLVTFPTRRNNILDIFATNRPTLLNKCLPIPGISDHEAIYIESMITAKYNPPVRRKILLWSKANFQTISQHIQDFNSKFLATFSITHEPPVQQMWNDFMNMCSDCMDLVPSKFSSIRFNQFWVNSKTKQICRKKKRMYNRARTTGKDSDWHKYYDLKKIAQYECRLAYSNYISNLINPETGNKKFWSFIKSQRQDYSGIPPLYGDTGTTDNDLAKAKLLKENTNMIPTLSGTPFPDMDHIEITVDGVTNLLSNLKSNKAGGPDKITARFLKEMASFLAPSLTILFKASFTQGILPDDWKKANVIPVYKKGDRSCAANYRPISLTCIVCKIMEHIICSNIFSHLDKYGILCDQQHGFRHKRSCETQLITTINDFATALNNSEQVDAIFLDLSKAFDTVPHKRLCYKLSFYGIRGTLLKWIECFLTDRTQQVIINDKCSDSLPVLSGVPQGSVLGPLLFMCYINDIPNDLKSTIRLYADDALLYRTIHNDSDVHALQNDLNILNTWANEWQMSFNPKKTEFLRITNKIKPLESHYHLQNTPIPIVIYAKYLGVVIDRNLKWNEHIKMVTNKANSVRGFLQLTWLSVLNMSKV